MKISTPLFLLVLSIPASTLLAEDMAPAKIEAIQKLMEVTGAVHFGSTMSESFATQMISSLKSKYPNSTEQSFDIIRNEVKSVITEELSKGKLEKLIYPIYDKYFTEEEIQGLIEFNKSALGRKANKVMPQLLQESMQAGQSWNQELSAILIKRVTAKLKQEGIEFGNRQQ
jgi:hypothetical protein